MVPDRIKAEVVAVLAHPDDEGVIAPLLARFALVDGERVVALYLTMGEMGTDRVASIRGPAFGLMRLTELHRTLDRLGVAMFHDLGRADLSPPDDPAALLASWDRDRTVSELTRFLRLLRPDRLMLWLPGPASGHTAHMAAGAAALLAWRSAASGDVYPEQIASEGLRAWTVPEVLVFFQADKVAYSKYPDDADLASRSGLRIDRVPVDGYEPSLRRRASDLAREAMKEQRSVGMGSGFERGGSFDAPLALIHVEGERGTPPEEAPGGLPLHLAIRPSGSQEFFERIASEARLPRLPRVFLPEATIRSGGAPQLTVTCVNEGRSRVEGRATLALPVGWTARPDGVKVSLGPSESVDLAWTLDGPPPSDPVFVRAEVVVDGGGRKGKTLGRTALAFTWPAPTHAP
jgi:LmbE family N-acetylglucosaminyl deacetylase